MTKTVEISLSQSLSFSVTEFWLIERIIDDLKCFPIAFGFQEVVHSFDCSSIAVLRNPSMVLTQPNFFKETYRPNFFKESDQPNFLKESYQPNMAPALAIKFLHTAV